MTEAEYEELKYAAIAAGYKPVRMTDDGKALLLEGVQEPWNSRADDGAALRLAVRLSLSICPPQEGFQIAFCQNDDATIDVGESAGNDPEAATRLAITRAAAKIGKQLGAAA